MFEITPTVCLYVPVSAVIQKFGVRQVLYDVRVIAYATLNFFFLQRVTVVSSLIISLTGGNGT